MTSHWIYLTEGLRIFRSSLRLKADGFTEYDGNAKAICGQIVEDCWNGRFFQTSTTNFPQFWTRDFGWCTASLLKLGYTEEVGKTLRYALDIFSQHGKLTTTISLRHTPFDFPKQAVDSLPWLLHSLALADNGELVEPFRPFLENETEKLVAIAVDQTTGLVKPKHFSSIKDFAIRKSSCYDTCMLALLSQSLGKLRLANPLRDFDYEKLLREHYWNGRFFYDDLAKQDYVAADANIFPFALGIISDRSMLRSALGQVHLAGLDHPLPVKYTSKSAPVRFIWQERLMRGYERDATWLHLGPLYIALLSKIDRQQAQQHLGRYTRMIERYKTYPEVLTPAGKPFTSPFYHCDQGMLWAANYLTL